MPDSFRGIIVIDTGLAEGSLIAITASLAIAVTLVVAALVRWIIHVTREASLFQSTHEQQKAADDATLAVIRLRDEAFQNLMAELSAELVAANRHNLAEILTTCISLIGEWSAADRCGRWVNTRKSRTPKFISEFVRTERSPSPADELTDVHESASRPTYRQFQSQDEQQFVLSCDDSVRLFDKPLTLPRDCFARGIYTIIYRDLWPRRESLGQLYLQYESRDVFATATTSAQLTVLASMIGGEIERTFAEQWLLESEQQFRSFSVAFPSKSTCHLRFKEWTEQGIIEQEHRQLLLILDGQGKIDCSETFGDGTFSSPKKGANRLGQLVAARRPRSCFLSMHTGSRCRSTANLPMSMKCG